MPIIGIQPIPELKTINGESLVGTGNIAISGSGEGPAEIADVNGLQTALDGKAATAHGHAIADVTNLQTALDGKVGTDDARLTDARTPTAHTHTLANIADAGTMSAQNANAVAVTGGSVTGLAGLSVVADTNADFLLNSTAITAGRIYSLRSLSTGQFVLRDSTEGADRVTVTTAGMTVDGTLRTTGAATVGTTNNTEGARLKARRESGTTAPIFSAEAAVGSFTGASIEARNTLTSASTFDLFRGIVDSDADAGGPNTVWRVDGQGSVFVGMGTSGNAALFAGGDNNFYIQNISSGSIVLRNTNGLEVFRAGSSGVGIGTTNPAANLHVNGPSIFARNEAAGPPLTLAEFRANGSYEDPNTAAQISFDSRYFVAAANGFHIDPNGSEVDNLGGGLRFYATGSYEDPSSFAMVQIEGFFDFVGNIRTKGMRFASGLINAADDAAAATAGVPINALYRTGSAVKIRVA